MNCGVCFLVGVCLDVAGFIALRCFGFRISIFWALMLDLADFLVTVGVC